MTQPDLVNNKRTQPSAAPLLQGHCESSARSAAATLSPWTPVTPGSASLMLTVSRSTTISLFVTFKAAKKALDASAAALSP